MSESGKYRPFHMPYRWKYLQEYDLFAGWFIQGEYPETKHVDITDIDGDVLSDIPRPIAEEIVAARDAFLAAMGYINERLGGTW